jgi:SAM-dependent methyltransferase
MVRTARGHNGAGNREERVRERTARAMRDYWDEGARRNAAWYVDTTLAYDAPDMERFVAGGEQIVADLLDRGAVQPTGRGLAVEIGSGLGRVCQALADRFERVIGVDVSPEMVQRAQDLVDNPRVTFQLGDGTGLGDIAGASADLVFSFTVFQHIPKASIVHRYLADAARVLRPGGVLVFQWNNLPGERMWALRRTALSVLQRTGVHPERYGRHAPEFLGTRIPLPPLRRTLERNGMELCATTGTGTLFACAWAVRSP